MEPVMKPAMLADFPWLEPEEWWELEPKQTALIKKILRFYPDMRLITNDSGQPVDAERLSPEPELDPEEEKSKQALEEEAIRRGYTKANMVRPKGVMPFLTKQKNVGEMENELLRNRRNSKWAALRPGAAGRGKRAVPGGI